MTLDAPRLSLADLQDVPGRREVAGSETVYAGRVWDVRSDRVVLVEGQEPVSRDYIEHTGAVAVAALREGEDGEPELFVIRQYRHPVAAEDWELPAGLLDVEGESGESAAQRELVEEADLQAGVWEELLRFTPSPGSLGEEITVFVATGLSDVDESERHERADEEAGMPCGWVPLATLVDAVMAGQLRNGPLLVSVLVLAEKLRRDAVR